jgi:serine/threonine-protein kinase
VTLAPGIKLGRYEIRSLLGAGGMGEVYVARDELINRDVAIKVLPVAFSSDGERLRRLNRKPRLQEPSTIQTFSPFTM